MSDRENSEMEIEETDTRTESTSMEETEGQDTDLRTSESDDWRHERNPRSSAEKRGHELGQSSGYLVRKGVEDCRYFVKNGRCGYGLSCRFNHPLLPYSGVRNCEQYLQTGQCSYGRKCRFSHPSTQFLPEKVSWPICKYFLRGGCKLGSSCQYNHSMRGNGAEPMRQATTWGRISDEKRHGAGSSSMPEKMERSDDVVVGQNSWLQRRRAQRNLQRGNIDLGQRRETEESGEEQTLRERKAHDLEEQKQREKVEEILRIDQIKSTVQSDEGVIQTEQRLEAYIESQNREAQEKAQEERRQQIDNARREARLHLEQMQPTVQIDDVDQLGQSLQDIGIERKEGDGV